MRRAGRLAVAAARNARAVAEIKAFVLGGRVRCRYDLAPGGCRWCGGARRVEKLADPVEWLAGIAG